MVLFLQGHFFVLTSNLKANIHIIPFQFVKNSYFMFYKVVWQRYLGEVGKFVAANLSKTPGTAYQFLSKSVKYCRSYDIKLWCVFYAPQGMFCQHYAC